MRLLWWLPTVVYAAAILFMTTLPSPSLPGRHLDKVVHFFAYAVLALSIQFSLRKSDYARPVTLAAALAVAFGALDETFQIFSPYRTASLFDLLADALGAVAGSLLMASLFRIRAKKQHDPPVPCKPA